MAAIPTMPAPPAPAAKVTGLESPVAVVGPQYCVPYDVELIIAEHVMNMDDASALVKDSNGNVMLKIKGRYIDLIHQKRWVQDANGACILTVQKKFRSCHDRWNIYRGESTEEEHRLCTVKIPHYIELVPQLNIYLPSNTSEAVCDFKVGKGYNASQYCFYLGDTEKVAAVMNDRENIKTQLLDQDSYGLTIYTNMDYAFIVAIATIIDAHRDMGYSI